MAWYFRNEGVSEIKPCVTWKIVRQLGLKYQVPTIFTVYSVFLIVSKELVVLTRFF